VLADCAPFILMVLNRRDVKEALLEVWDPQSYHSLGSLPLLKVFLVLLNVFLLLLNVFLQFLHRGVRMIGVGI